MLSLCLESFFDLWFHSLFKIYAFFVFSPFPNPFASLYERRDPCWRLHFFPRMPAKEASSALALQNVETTNQGDRGFRILSEARGEVVEGRETVYPRTSLPLPPSSPFLAASFLCLSFFFLCMFSPSSERCSLSFPRPRSRFGTSQFTFTPPSLPFFQFLLFRPLSFLPCSLRFSDAFCLIFPFALFRIRRFFLFRMPFLRKPSAFRSHPVGT